MDVMEQLVALLKCGGVRDFPFNAVLADYLISNGVTGQEWYYVNDYPREDGTYIVKTNTGAITTARFYAFKSFPPDAFHFPSFFFFPLLCLLILDFIQQINNSSKFAINANCEKLHNKQRHENSNL